MMEQADGGRNERDSAAEGRDRAADQRDERGGRRDGLGDERDRVAERRNELAERRDRSGDERDRAADERDVAAEYLEKTGGTAGWSEATRVESSVRARQDASADRGRASEDREAGARERARADRDRGASHADRLGGEGERSDAGHDRRTAVADRHAAARDRNSAAMDGLTGVFTRMAGFHELERDIARTRRDGLPLTVAFVDVDHLKVVNDSFGHAAGDRLLAEVTVALRAAFRAYDLIMRYGGDEFICASSGLHAAEVRERLRTAVLYLREDLAHGSFTVGVAELRPADGPGELIARADQDLYLARVGREG